jgi:prophage antirepressor-like protein
MKDSELVTFTNESVGELRGFIKDGEPMFLAGQVCRCLGIKNSREAVSVIRERMKIAGIDGVGDTDIIITDALGRKQRATAISEPFLYELIFTSRKQKAIKFRAWVTTEVLPSLRKHGEYRMTGKLIRRSLTDKLVESGETERMHGHAFSTYSILINKSLGLPNRVNRDELDETTLEKIATRENLVSAFLAEGKTYHFIKEAIETLAK